MKSYRFAILLLMAGGLGYFTACTTTGRNTKAPSQSDPQPRLAELRRQGGQASLTIFPVMLAGQSNKDAADVLGLMLERAGMEQLDTTEVVFKPAENTEFEQLSAAFGKFVRRQELPTGYALYMEVTGSPATGVDEVWAVLVEQNGDLVWAERQGPEDRAFKRVQPRNPMSCCSLVSQRLIKTLDLIPPPADQVKNGKMARLWAEKSGTPDDAEREAMDQRRKLMSKAGKGRELTVYPVQINNQAHGDAGQELTNILIDDRLAEVQVAKDEPWFRIQPNSNEQRRLWDLAHAFRDYVRAHPPETEYALCAEYVLREDLQKVWSVHFVVCDRKGEWVIVDFQNDQQPDFKRLKPQSRADCAELVAKRLKRIL